MRLLKDMERWLQTMLARLLRNWAFGTKCAGHRISPSTNTDAMLVPELSLCTSLSTKSRRSRLTTD
jgi:hypothetical protein